MWAAFTLYGAGYARSVCDSAATPGEVLATLHHLDRDLLADVLRHRDRLVRRAVPAGGWFRGAGLTAEHGPRLQVLRLLAEHLRQPGEHDVLLAVRQLGQHGSVDGDDQRHPVADQRPALRVDDRAARRRDQYLAGVVLRGGLGVVRVATSPACTRAAPNSVHSKEKTSTPITNNRNRGLSGAVEADRNSWQHPPAFASRHDAAHDPHDQRDHHDRADHVVPGGDAEPDPELAPVDRRIVQQRTRSRSRGRAKARRRARRSARHRAGRPDRWTSRGGSARPRSRRSRAPVPTGPRCGRPAVRRRAAGRRRIRRSRPTPVRGTGRAR